MKVWKKSKGNRIRASDQSLVYHFCIGWLLLLFVAVFLLLNLRQLLVTNWKDFNLLHAGITGTTYNFITVLIATGVCASVAFLYYRYGYDRIKRLLHRQKLARMVLENKWYEAENTKDSGFFTDLQSRSREKIVWFPKIYYQMEKGLLHIQRSKGRIFKTGVSFYRRIDNKKRWRFFSAIYRRNLPAVV